VTRREFADLEARLGAQIAMAVQRTDRLREVALARLDHRLSLSELTRGEVDRKLTNLSRALTGISDEVSTLQQRGDAMDAQLGQKLAELQGGYDENQQRGLDTGQNGGSDGSGLGGQHRRLARLEGLAEEHFRQAEESSRSLRNFATRLALLEGEKDIGAEAATKDNNLESQIWQLQHDLSGVTERVNRLDTEANSEHGWSARLEEQAVKLTGLRTKAEHQEETYMSFRDFIRQDLEAKFGQLKQSLKDTGNDQDTIRERVDSLTNWSEDTEQVIERLRGALSAISEAPAKTAKIWMREGSSPPKEGKLAALTPPEVENSPTFNT